MLDIQEYMNIRDHTTFKVGGQFRYFAFITQPSQLQEVYDFAKEKNLPLKVLGGGSNMVFPDGIVDMVVACMQLSGFDVISETDEYMDIKIGAGENWDTFVGKTVDMNLSGIEAMSAIPGTAGATPVQNVGAYGQEAKDTILSVEVYDLSEGVFKTLSNKECRFSYRDSIFKHEGKDTYVITSVVYRLSKDKPKVPDYPGVSKYFKEAGIENPTLLEIRKAITEIRRKKLPDPKEVSNVGSFFKNPIVQNEVALKLKEAYETVTLFKVDEFHIKIPAGWLIENAGLKGKDFGPISTYVHNALVLINNGEATKADVVSAKDQIIEAVSQKFGITLETEPEFV